VAGHRIEPAGCWRIRILGRLSNALTRLFIEILALQDQSPAKPIGLACPPSRRHSHRDDTESAEDRRAAND